MRSLGTDSKLRRTAGLAEMEQLLAVARKSYDYVFIEIAPVMSVVDAKVIEHFIDQFVFVVDLGETTGIWSSTRSEKRRSFGTAWLCHPEQGGPGRDPEDLSPTRASSPRNITRAEPPARQTSGSPDRTPIEKLARIGAPIRDRDVRDRVIYNPPTHPFSQHAITIAGLKCSAKPQN